MMKPKEKMKVAVKKIETAAAKVWSNIDPCNEECPLLGDCPHVASGKCAVQRDYLRTVMSGLLAGARGPSGKVDEHKMVVIGYHLMPLYTQLIKFMMKEQEYRGAKFYTTEKGDIKVHPVYREIRNILSSIHSISKDIGLMDVAKSYTSIEMTRNGGNGYYEAISRMG
jgi:hypothetical protein